MFVWIKKHSSTIITVLVTVGFLIYIYGCEPKTKSIIDDGRLINRQELQLELDQVMAIFQLRMVDLDKQDELRAIILQNALILVQGQPLNVLGLLTGIAGIYGVAQAGTKVSTSVKTTLTKRKNQNG